MYDEVNMDSTPSYGIYVDDKRKTWYDENTRKQKQDVPPNPEKEEFTNYIPPKKEKIETPKKEKFGNIIQGGQIDLNTRMLILIVLVCAIYLVHMCYTMTSKINGIMLMQNILLSTSIKKN